MVEDYAALEEEGVTGLKKGKYTLRKVCSGDSKGLLGGGHNMAAPVVLLLHKFCTNDQYKAKSSHRATSIGLPLWKGGCFRSGSSTLLL